MRRVKKAQKGAKMNKKQLVAKISSSMNLSKADAERTFDGITEIILSCLKGDEQVKIAGFGTYKVAKRKARVGRNPRTGEQIQIAASQKLSFYQQKHLKRCLINKFLKQPLFFKKIKAVFYVYIIFNNFCFLPRSFSNPYLVKDHNIEFIFVQ